MEFSVVYGYRRVIAINIVYTVDLENFIVKNIKFRRDLIS